MTDYQVAVHESAHAVVALVRGVPTRRIVLHRTGAERGVWRPGVSFGELDVMDAAVILCAGPAAERKLSGLPAVGGDSDLEAAQDLVGLRLDAYRVIAEAAVSVHWNAITNVANALVRRRKLSGNQIWDLMWRRT